MEYFATIAANSITSTTVLGIVARRPHSIMMEDPSMWKRAIRTNADYEALVLGDCYFTREIINPRETDLWFLHWAGLNAKGQPRMFLVRQENNWIGVNRVRYNPYISVDEVDNQAVFTPLDNILIDVGNASYCCIKLALGIDDLEKLVEAEKLFCNKV